jgi:L-iditol 2-dehydrogenase
VKALVLEANARLSVQDRPIPEPGAGEVLLRMAFAGICSSDLFRAFAGGAHKYPLVMGHELSGVVAESRVEGIAAGQKACVFPLLPCRKCSDCQERRWRLCSDYDYFGSRRDGGFQEFLAVPAWNILSLPAEMDLSLACLVEPVAVAAHAVGSIQKDNLFRVLILGSGFIGIVMALMLKKRFPAAEIKLYDRNKSKLELVQELGLQIWGDDSLFESFDVVIEAAGAEKTYVQSINMAENGAELIWMGNPKRDLLLPQSLLSMVLRKELKIYGVWNSQYNPGGADDWQKAIGFIQENQLSLQKLLTRKVFLNEAPELLCRLYNMKTSAQNNREIKSVIAF